MTVRILASNEDFRLYDEWISAHPQGNLWQSIERKKYLEACGKIVRIYVAGDDQKNIIASALVVVDRTSGGYSTWDIPRGPLWSECRIENVELKMNHGKSAVECLLGKIIEDAKRDRCIALYLSPTSKFSIFNFQFSIRHIHPQATRILDLTQTEDHILAGMHPKGRYNIGVAEKHGVHSAMGSENDIDAFYELLRNTSGRDGFKISQKSHYTRFLTSLRHSFILMATHQGKAIAGLIGIIWHGTGIYYYGASSYEHRHLMAPYLLQWEAIRHCKAAGCIRYDLLGIAPEGAGNDNPWTGITDFKRKFGGQVITYPQEQMIVLRPFVKMMLEWKRKIIG